MGTHVLMKSFLVRSMPRSPAIRLTVRALNRRDVLTRLGAVAGATALAGCERLNLPEGAADTAPPGTGDVIPPITPNDDFYVTSCCGSPDVDPAAWSLRIVDGISGGELGSLDTAALDAMDGRDKEHTLECIGGGPYNRAIGNAIWTGLPLPELLDLLGIEVPSGAVEIVITGADDYATSIPITDLDKPLWLVWRMNGEPLPTAHGTVIRLLNPGRYGTKNPKWITEIRFVDEPFVGYWESRGWSNSAEYKANTFFLSPDYNAVVTAGAVRLLGTALAGSDPVARVEVSLDGGRTWTDAEITYQNGPDIWTLWAFDWDAEAGDYDLQVRATTESGVLSNADPDGTDPSSGYDGSMLIHVSVRT
jgi:DMSO/TMAO reductase YedYZ molybdopterin-dependent catalytic subunit